MPIPALLTLYLAGIATFASPCVLPLLPVYLAALGSADPERRRPLWHNAAGFTLGLSGVFVALGLTATALASALSSHRRVMMLGVGIIMLVLGGKLLGVLRLPGLDREARPVLSRLPSAHGFFGSLLFGVGFALGWTPCVGPVLAAALGYAASHSASLGSAALQLGVYALGLSTPLILASLAAQRVLELSRRLRGVTPFVQRGLGALLVLVGVLVATDRISAVVPSVKTEDETCVSQQGNACLVPELATGAASDGEPQRLPAGKPRLLEFVSAHCPVCARMAPLVAELERACTQGDGTMLRLAVESPEGRALAQRYQVHAVPTFLQVDSDGNEVERALGEQSRTQIQNALESVRGSACPSL
ncbi:MAG TPA: cytochrome c biogenesis protein/redoxin [Polyangiaceae bacterium]|nr:cytochrome c biogenesis protein/redoxin [Polyangiaceae bacterium]